MKKLAVLMMVLAVAVTSGAIAHADLNHGLTAYWSFDECNATDETGNGYNGSLSGSPACQGGVLGKAFYLDSHNDHIKFSGALGPDNIKAFSFWINSKGPDGINDSGMVIAKYTWFGGRSFFITSHDGNISKIYLRLYSRGDTYGGDRISSYYENPESLDPEKYTIINNTKLETDAWKHVVANITPTELEIWIDGRITNKVKRDYQHYFDSSEPVYIGNAFQMGGDFVFNYRLNGTIDDFRVYDRPLTEAEIQQLFGLRLSIATTCDKAILTWTGYSRATFHIFKETSPFTTIEGLSPVAVLDRNRRSYEMGSLEFGTSYYVAVAAVDEVGNITDSIDAQEVLITGSLCFDRKYYNLTAILIMEFANNIL